MKYPGVIVLLVGFTILLCSGGKEKMEKIKIGNQVWATENLDVTTFRNGDVIQQATNQGEWQGGIFAGKPLWCYYQFDPGNGERYGKLYNWYAVNDERGLAPKGWRVANHDDWMELITTVSDGGVPGRKLKSMTGWPEEDYATNSSGFSAVPGGFAMNSDFHHAGIQAWWWDANEYAPDSTGHDVKCFYLNNGTSAPEEWPAHKYWGAAVRCIKE